jgi:pimeloyl-ACP methyl ester carboxylesterase
MAVAGRSCALSFERDRRKYWGSTMTIQPEFATVQTNGIRLRVALAGKGPLVVLVHGWPESWYSWRHQIPALAEAGYRVAAPDVRGYGGSDKPAAIEAYAIKEMCADIAGLGPSISDLGPIIRPPSSVLA